MAKYFSNFYIRFAEDLVGQLIYYMAGFERKITN